MPQQQQQQEQQELEPEEHQGKGVPIDDANDMGFALLEASLAGRVDVINSLLENHKVPINSQDPETGNTALHIACAESRADSVRALLRAQAATDIRNYDGKLPLELGDEKVKQAFQQELLQHVATGNIQGIKSLLGSGVDVNQGDGTVHNATLLHWAASFGQGKDVLELLLQAGADVNKQNAAGGTPLHEAVDNGHLEAVETLLLYGADKSIEDNQGQKPIDLLDENEDAEMKHLFETVVAQAHWKNKGTLPGSQENGKKAKNENGEASLNLGDSIPNNLDPANEATRDDSGNEETQLRRVLEEKDMVLKSLRETVELLLQDRGVLKYIQRLQDEVERLEKELAILRARNEQLQQICVKSEKQLEIAHKDNALLRSAIHDKEQRLLEMLDHKQERTEDEMDRDNFVERNSNEDDQSNPVDGTSDPLVQPTDEEYRVLKVERNRLARELEIERRQRYEEARIHLAYANQLRKDLDATRQLLESRTDLLHVEADHLVTSFRDLSKVQKKNRSNRGILSAIYYTLFGGEDEVGEEEDLEVGFSDEEEEDEDEDAESNVLSDHGEEDVQNA